MLPAYCYYFNINLYSLYNYGKWQKMHLSLKKRHP